MKVIDVIGKIMSTQSRLYKRPAEPTSLLSMKKLKPKGVEDLVLLAILHETSIGLTDEQIEIRTRGKHQTMSSARNRLVKKGLVSPTGETRKTSSGRKANIWCLTMDGTIKAIKIERNQNEQ